MALFDTALSFTGAATASTNRAVGALKNFFSTTYGLLPTDPHATDSRSFVLTSSWTVLAISSLILLAVTRIARFVGITRRPGPSFTYAWLWLGALSWILRARDAQALFYMIGFGLVCSWYAVQVVYKDLWGRICAYWGQFFPAWCLSPIARLGDILLHIVPFVLSLGNYKEVAIRHVIQAVIYERVYFLAVDGSAFGSGGRVNDVYAVHPPCPPEVFYTLQMFSTVGYFIAVTCSAADPFQRHFLQILWFSIFALIIINSLGLPQRFIERIGKRRATPVSPTPADIHVPQSMAAPTTIYCELPTAYWGEINLRVSKVFSSIADTSIFCGLSSPSTAERSASSDQVDDDEVYGPTAISSSSDPSCVGSPPSRSKFARMSVEEEDNSSLDDSPLSRFSRSRKGWRDSHRSGLFPPRGCLEVSTVEVSAEIRRVTECQRVQSRRHTRSR